MNTQPNLADAHTTSAPTRAAFTLVELAIAVAVVFTGVLALFSLITSGLESSSKSVADTQSALFADEIFSRLGAESQTAAEAGIVPPDNPAAGTLMWRKFWYDFATGATNLPVAAHGVWQGTMIHIPRPNTRSPMVIFGNGNIYTARFATVSMHFPGVSNVVNHAMRYQLNVGLGAGASGNGWHTFNAGSRAQVLANTNIFVTLRVWDGEFGSDTNDPLTFYTEFDNPGDL